MYINVYTMYVHYLWIHSMKSVFWHKKWITSGTHDSPAQIRLPFHTPKGTQGTINNMSTMQQQDLDTGFCLTPKFRAVIGS